MDGQRDRNAAIISAHLVNKRLDGVATRLANWGRDYPRVAPNPICRACP